MVSVIQSVKKKKKKGVGRIRKIQVDYSTERNYVEKHGAIGFHIDPDMLVNFHYDRKAQSISAIAEVVALYIWQQLQGMPCVKITLPYTAFQAFRITSAECKRAIQALLAEGLLKELWRDRYTIDVCIANTYLLSRANMRGMTEVA